MDLNGKRILISGATGLIGAAVCASLRGRGAAPVALTRDPARAEGEAIGWNPAQGQLDPAALNGIDAVIHLAGEPIANGRWNAERRARIMSSRVQSTQLLARAIQAASSPPQVFLCASAIGYYGHRGDAMLDETSPRGAGFLADVCEAWEAACEPLRVAGQRVANLRIGVVLSRGGGALKSMLTPFKLGLGGPLGSGRQFWSWIHLNDVVGAFLHVLERDELNGPFNLTAPQPVRNVEFTRQLGHTLHRPALLPAPAPALRLLLGDMADALLLSSMRVLPQALLSSGYTFEYTALEPALRAELG